MNQKLKLALDRLSAAIKHYEQRWDADGLHRSCEVLDGRSVVLRWTSWGRPTVWRIVGRCGESEHRPLIEHPIDDRVKLAHLLPKLVEMVEASNDGLVSAIDSILTRLGGRE